jgi:hypothetical protein
MRTRYFMLTGFVNHATAETRKLKCTLNPRVTAEVKAPMSRKVPPILAKLRMRYIPGC